MGLTPTPRPFRLHPQLLADCHRLGQLRFCHLLLNRNAALPWFILVPETELSDLLDLPPVLRSKAMDDAAHISGFIKGTLGYPKVNFAAIGNVVPQLHLHVVGRREGDSCWPSPVWGHLEESVSYSEAQLEYIRRGIEAPS